MKNKYELSVSEQKAVNDFLESRGLPTNVNVTFGDVVLKTRYSEIYSRSEIDDFSTAIFLGTRLGLPLIMANMVCVSDAEAIIAIEREGGLGVPPQMLPLKERLAMLDVISRADSAYINNPLTVGPDRMLADAKELMEKHGIYSLVVVDDLHRPVGILSTRDWRYEKNETKLVKDLMGGRRKLYKAPKDISFDEAARILRRHRIEKLPLLDLKGKLVGMITAHGLFYKHHHPRATRDEKGRFLKIGSIGVGRRFSAEHMKEVQLQVRKGICMLLIDTARAFSINTKEAVETIKKHYPQLPLMVGNVDCPEGAKALFEWGAEIVKVGIGPGEACRTREIGVGIPQLSAIAKCAAIAGPNRFIVADGGMKSPGDICKAIVAGASAVMSGSLFIGAIESAAEDHLNKQGLRVKEYIGSASFKAQQERIRHGTLDRSRRPEGVAQEMPVTGTMKELVEDLIKGMRSAMSYMGVSSIDELRTKGRFELQTQAGSYEGLKRK